MKSASFTMLKAGKAEVWQTRQTLCWEEPSFLIHQGLPRILLFPGISLPLPIPSKNEQRDVTNFAMLEEQTFARGTS